MEPVLPDFDVLISEGTRLLNAGRREDARVVFERAARLAEEAHGAHSALVLRALCGCLASVDVLAKDARERGLSALATEIERRVAELALGHSASAPALAIFALTGCGLSAQGYDRLREARHYYESALAIRALAVGSENEKSAILRGLLIDVLIDLGEMEAALTTCDVDLQAIAGFPKQKPHIILDLFRKGRCLVALRRGAEAVAVLERAIALEGDGRSDGPRGRIAAELAAYLDAARRVAADETR
jgi:tetratricopeptide (TPR) repeat protein